MARGRRKNTDGRTALGGMVGKIKGLGYASSAYRLTLGGHTPDRILLQPADMLPGDAGRGGPSCAARCRRAKRAVRRPAAAPLGSHALKEDKKAITPP